MRGIIQRAIIIRSIQFMKVYRRHVTAKMTARNRRTRTRMYGGVGARRENPPDDPIGRSG